MKLFGSENLEKIATRYGSTLVIGTWACVNFFLLYQYGIKTDGESIKPIAEAQRLANGQGLSAMSYTMYFTEIFLIYLKMITGAGYWLPVLFHLALNLTALLCFRRFLTRFLTSGFLSAVGCLLLISCFPYQLYNSFLYTESVFFSLALIYSTYLLSIERFTLRKSIAVLILLTLLCLSRPHGLFFIGASLVYLFFFLSASVKPFTRIMLFIFAGIAAIFLLDRMMGSGGEIDIMLPFKDERIICDVPTLNTNVSLDIISDGNSLRGLFYYVTHNPEQFFRLALLKTKAFFGLTRPYYSGGHNLYLMAFFYSLYALALAAVLRFRRHLPIGFIYFCALILIYWISVVFSCDEWHNRFFLGLTPFLIAAGLYAFKPKRQIL